MSQIPSSRSLSLFSDLTLISAAGYIFEMILCNADVISSFDVANAILDFLKDYKNSAITNIMFPTGHDIMYYNITISGNKQYFGGNTY